MENPSGRSTSGGGNPRQAQGLMAPAARKVRVALDLAAMVGQFKVLAALFHIGLMDNVFLDQVHQVPIDRRLIGGLGADLLGDLLLRERMFGSQHRRDNRDPAVRSASVWRLAGR